MRSLPLNGAAMLVGRASPRGVAPQIAREIAVVVAAIAAVLVVTRLATVLEAVSIEHAGLLLSVTASAFAAMAAILAALAGRLTRDHRLTWLSSTLAFYSVVDVPATTTSWLASPVNPVANASRMVACAVAVGLLCASLCPPVKRWPSGRWAGAVIGVVLTLGAGWIAQFYPGTAQLVSSSVPLRLSLSVIGV